MNYLGIDLWDKVCGIAYTVEWVVFAWNAIVRTALVWNLHHLIQEKNIHTIVVGLPYDLYGIDTRQLEKTKKFISKLRSIFPNILIEEEDERFTTFEAYNILEWSVKSSLHKEKKDSLSALLILESYLYRKNWE